MIDLSRERVCKPVLKLDFTAYGIMEILWSPSQNLDSAYIFRQTKHQPGDIQKISDYLPKTCFRSVA
jgi:hypothetical protein